jgi:Secretion system C-terminal sorting domain
MIKSLLITLFSISLFATNSYAQGMQAALGVGSTPNKLNVYIKPTGDVLAPGSISTLQWNIAVPISVVDFPMPTVTASNIVGVTPIGWTIDPMITEDGFKHYNITTTVSPINMAFTDGVEVLAIELDFGTPIPQEIALITLAEAGINFQMLFYCTGLINVDGGNSYYSRTATDSVGNGPSFDIVNGTLGTANSVMYLNKPSLWVTASPTSVDAIMLNVINNSNDAILNFDVVGEDESTENYLVERSLDGLSFEALGIVIASPDATKSNKYSFIDKTFKLSSKNEAYYKIKNIDVKGNLHLSNTAKVSLKEYVGVAIYPNPTQNVIKIETSLNNSVLEILDFKGAIVFSSALKSNFSEFNISNLTAGTYLIIVKNETNRYSEKLVKTD